MGFGNPAHLFSWVMRMGCYLTFLSFSVFVCIIGTIVLFRGLYKMMHVNDFPWLRVSTGKWWLWNHEAKGLTLPFSYFPRRGVKAQGLDQSPRRRERWRLDLGCVDGGWFTHQFLSMTFGNPSVLCWNRVFQWTKHFKMHSTWWYPVKWRMGSYH